MDKYTLENNMLLSKLEDYHIYLASSSPRRHQLLTDMEIKFSYLPISIEEKFSNHLSPEEAVEYLSLLKLSSINRNLYSKNSIFITCDTVVVANNKIIKKPKNKEDAIKILNLLSNSSHCVLSGLTVATPFKVYTKHQVTKVKFGELSEPEIDYYVEKYKPFDKAGAYGIQEWIGHIGMEKIEGDFYNIIGLPTRLLWKMLEVAVSDIG